MSSELLASLWKATLETLYMTSVAAVLESIDAGRITPPPSGTRVPAALRRVLQRALSPAPASRFVDMSASDRAVLEGYLKKLVDRRAS